MIIKAAFFASLVLFEAAWLYILAKAAITVGDWVLS